MKDGKIDEYVAEFDTLVAQAGYKADNAQTSVAVARAACFF
jgi:hypothetical protein